MFDPVSAAVIGLGGASLVGGFMQSDAAGDAAEASASASRDASALQYKMFLEQQAAMEPWRASGVNALNQLNALMGLPQVPTRARLASGERGEGGSVRFIPGTGPVTAPTNGTRWSGGDPRVNILTRRPEFEGVAGATTTPPPDPSQDWRSLMDPGYAFRKQEGVNALAAAGAASGNYGSGNMGVALEDFGQNLASQEFMNVYNRLAGMSGTGQVQSQAIGNMGVNTGNTMANYLNQAGQNIAQGQIAGSNALWGGVRDASNALASYYMFRPSGVPAGWTDIGGAMPWLK